jgi:Phospholipase B
VLQPTPDGTDLFAGHEMWASYWQMLNLFKHYEFGPTPIHFNSYPGLLSSEDDFYQLGGGKNMTVMETTNGVFNLALYDAITPSTLMSWIRVMVSNRMSSSGEEWCNTMQKYNSGTYNNQWIIVDMKKFDPSSPKFGANGKPQLEPGTLWIGSQLPAFWKQADVTHVVNTQGYWPSYNIPYFKEVFDKAGYPAMVKKQGDLWSYENCPRAKIFRRQEALIVDIPNLLEFMRYNDWRNDKDSLDCPLNQIASRLDLSPPNYSTTMPYCAPAAFGAINAKVTSHRLQENFHAWVIAGPTHEFLRPFQWDTETVHQFPTAKHYGQPDIFDMFWLSTRPMEAGPELFADPLPTRFTSGRK